MTRSKFSEQQVIAILKQAENGRPVAEVCRENSISTSTYFKWKSKYGGMEASDIRRMRELEEENRQQKIAAVLEAFISQQRQAEKQKA